MGSVDPVPLLMTTDTGPHNPAVESEHAYGEAFTRGPSAPELFQYCLFRKEGRVLTWGACRTKIGAHVNLAHLWLWRGGGGASVRARTAHDSRAS